MGNAHYSQYELTRSTGMNSSVLVDHVKTRDGLLISCIRGELTVTTYQLTRDTDQEPAGVDEKTLSQMIKSNLINWWRTAHPVYPLLIGTTTGRPSVTSLVESVVLSVRGCVDQNSVQLIGRLAHDLLSNVRTDLTRRRQADYDVTVDRSSAMTSSYGDEWLNVFSVFDARSLSASAASIESIHIFVVSNIIRRPIIVVSTSPNHRGVYLPLLHDVSHCCRHPVVITALSRSTSLDDAVFEPLVACLKPRSLSSVTSQLELAIPLVGHDLVPLPVRCCHVADEMQSAVVMETYLMLTELPYTTSHGINMMVCAQLGSKTPDRAVELSLTEHAEHSVVQRGDDNNRQNTTGGGNICLVGGCKFYGLREYNGKCLMCYQKDKQTPNTAAVSGQHTPPRTVVTSRSPMTSSSTTPWISGSSPCDVKLTSVSRCVVPECQMYGSAVNGGRCSKHSVNVDQQMVSTCWNVPTAGRSNESQLVPSGASRNNGVEKAARRHVDFNCQPVAFRNGVYAGPRQCMTEECPGTTFDDTLLCINCQQIQQHVLRQHERNRSRQSPGHYCTAPTPVAVVTAPNGVVMTKHPVAMPCRNKACDRYGDVSFGGYCSVCSSLLQHVTTN